MIRTFRYRGLERFFRTGSKAGIQPKHAKRLRLQLGRLDSATEPADWDCPGYAEICIAGASSDMDMPGWRLHPLKGDLDGFWAVWVDENWRLTFTFEGPDAVQVDYRDYH